MTARFLLDTNICIYIRRRRPPEVLARFEKLRPGEAVLSIITHGELIYGAEKNQRRQASLQQLDELVALLPVMPTPENTAREYGSIRAALEAAGESIGGNDLWIAAHAKAAGLILVTNNAREFKRVAGLKVQNWVE